AVKADDLDDVGTAHDPLPLGRAVLAVDDLRPTTRSGVTLGGVRDEGDESLRDRLPLVDHLSGDLLLARIAATRDTQDCRDYQTQEAGAFHSLNPPTGKPSLRRARPWYVARSIESRIKWTEPSVSRKLAPLVW